MNDKNSLPVEKTGCASCQRHTRRPQAARSPVDGAAAAADLQLSRGAGSGDGAGDVGRDGSVRMLGTSNSSTTE